MFDKESIYDEEIAPLMAQIVAICKRENMPMAAQFYLKQEREDAEYEHHAMWCTTILNFKDIHPEHKQHLVEVAETMKYGKRGKPVILTSIVRTQDDN